MTSSKFCFVSKLCGRGKWLDPRKASILIFWINKLYFSATKWSNRMHRCRRSPRKKLKPKVSSRRLLRIDGTHARASSGKNVPIFKKGHTTSTLKDFSFFGDLHLNIRRVSLNKKDYSFWMLSLVKQGKKRLQYSPRESGATKQPMEYRKRDGS